MLRFDQVIPTVVRVCQADPRFAALSAVAIVRDLRGRVRLFLRTDLSAVEVAELQRALEHALGPYFVGPLWLSSAPGQEGRLATQMLALAEPLSGVEFEDPATGEGGSAQPGRFFRLERHLSKQVWLSTERPAPPWPLTEGRPAIVTFHSFKGGVGRTTALVACAWQLAHKGQRVVILDLDLESPGAGALLGVKTERGALEFVIEYLATEQPDLSDLSGPAVALGAEAERIDVIPAGNLDTDYLEKLARLDFLSRDLSDKAAASPVDNALRRLLKEVAAQLRPDYILIDSRAGLHDLAGLSLHSLAHVDVLFARASEQGYQGLELTVRSLAQRKGLELLSVVVHALSPMDRESKETQRIETEFRAQSFRIFNENVPLRQAPTETDTGASHYPWPVPFNPALLHFTSIAGKRDDLFARPYHELRTHIEELCQPPEPEA